MQHIKAALTLDRRAKLPEDVILRIKFFNKFYDYYIMGNYSFFIKN